MQRIGGWLPTLLCALPLLSAQDKDQWWKHALFYEIYPRSFQDTNGDGVGDLKGIARRLDYVKTLGANAIWISPIYPSPEIDFGYDISDYVGVDPLYGTMADFDGLVKEAHGRGIKVIMDLVLNHTSDRHKWFVESASSKTNPKRDWYIWRDGKGPGKPPNNWQSVFGHSAWKYDGKTGQWYYHKFYAEQPDLNWWNPEVRRAMYDVARFWMRKGVDGFRLDAITTLFEEKDLRDEQALGGTNQYGDPMIANVVTDNLPEVHEVLRELRKVTNEFPGRVLIGETYLPNANELRKMYGEHNDELQLPMDLQVGMINKLNVDEFRTKINDAETKIGGNIPLFVFDNHDNPRSWNRYGDGTHDEAIARMIAAILLTSRSVAMMYYGQEIGMVTTPPTRKEDVKDPVGITGWPKDKGRDGERTPMQWSGAKNAGFTTGTPWLPIPDSYRRVNVVAETHRSTSLLRWYERLIQLRATNAALRDGEEIMLNPDDSHVLSWLRKNADGTSVVVACNFSYEDQKFTFDLKKQGVAGTLGTILIASDGHTGDAALQDVKLAPFGVFVAQVK